MEKMEAIKKEVLIEEYKAICLLIFQDKYLKRNKELQKKILKSLDKQLNHAVQEMII